MFNFCFCYSLVREYGCNLLSSFLKPHWYMFHVHLQKCLFSFYLQSMWFTSHGRTLFARLLFYLILYILIYFYLSIRFAQYREMALNSPIAVMDFSIFSCILRFALNISEFCSHEKIF